MNLYPKDNEKITASTTTMSGPVGKFHIREIIIPVIVPKLPSKTAQNLYSGSDLLIFRAAPAGIAIKATVIRPPTK